MLPASNATLTSIMGGGFTADYDQPATSGTARWQGTVGVYVVEEIITVASATRRAGEGADSVNELTRTYLVLDAELGRLVQTGDTLTYTLDGVTSTRVARNVRVTPIVSTARVTFENE